MARRVSDRPRYFPKKPRYANRDAEIRARYKARRQTGETLRQIAADYGISAPRVCMIVKGRTDYLLLRKVRTHG